MVTHDVLEAASLADKLIVYSGGRIVQTGTPEEVFAAPAIDEVRRLVAPKDLYRSCFTS
jgi:ABC-type proline/glycine betaine transport system ATPase subunit